MQPIVIRGLTRSYEIDAAWQPSPLAFLRTTPELSGADPRLERIEIEAAHGHFRAALPGGPKFAGPLRWLAAQLDAAILRETLEGASAGLTLPGALLRDPLGRRVALLGGRGSGKSWLSVALLTIGWRFEGDAFVVVGADGVRALPRSIRLRDPLRALPAAWRERLETCPCLSEYGEQEIRAVDPRLFGSDWKVATGPVTTLLFLERNPGGRGGLRRFDAMRAYRASIGLSYGRMSGDSAVNLHRVIAGANAFRLRVGRIEEAIRHVARAARQAGEPNAVELAYFAVTDYRTPS